MAYRRTNTFTPPDLSKAQSIEEVKSIVLKWAKEICDKLNTELTNVERG
jgi:uncharacterized Fe-S cluster-containing MiaB family protein